MCGVCHTWYQVIFAAQQKSEEFERALSHQHMDMAGDEKGRLALDLLALLAGGEHEDEAGAIRAGEQLKSIWNEAHTCS